MSLLKYWEKSNGIAEIVRILFYFEIHHFQFSNQNKFSTKGFHNNYQSCVWLKHEFQLFWNMLNLLNIILYQQSVLQLIWNMFFKYIETCSIMFCLLITFPWQQVLVQEIWNMILHIEHNYQTVINYAA